MNTFKYNIQSRESKRNGTVYDVYFYIDGKQKCLRGHKTKTAAKQAFNDFMEQQLVAPKNEPTKSAIFYEDARKIYLNAIQYTVKESSLYDFKHTSAAYHDVFFKHKNLMTMTKQDILAFQDWLCSRKKENGILLSAKYVAKVYGQFRSFYNWCIVRLDCPDVIKGLSLPVRKQQKREYAIWSQDDFNRFIATVDSPKYKALFTTLFYCGLRVGELQALKVSDYDGSSIHVHATYTKKTLDGSSFKITDTKNYKSRHVPVPKPCKAVLDEFVLNRKPNEFLFGKDTPIALNSIRSVLETRIARADVPRIRIHDLRHSYVSLLISRGANFAVVASLIGDTLDQVIKTYAHSIDDDKISVINTII